MRPLRDELALPKNVEVSPRDVPVPNEEVQWGTRHYKGMAKAWHLGWGMKCDEYRITAPALRHGHFSVGPPWWDGRRSSVGRPSALREIMDFRSLRWQFPILRRAFVPWSWRTWDIWIRSWKRLKRRIESMEGLYVCIYLHMYIYIL